MGGELDRVGQQVEQHLPEARRVSLHPDGGRLLGLPANLDAIPGHLARHGERVGAQVHHLEGHRLEHQPASLDLRGVEDVVDDGEQRLAAAMDDPERLRLRLIELTLLQQGHHADHAVERSANLMAHHGQEVALRSVGRVGRLGELPLASERLLQRTGALRHQGVQPAALGLQPADSPHSHGPAAPDEKAEPQGYRPGRSPPRRRHLEADPPRRRHPPGATVSEPHLEDVGAVTERGKGQLGAVLRHPVAVHPVHPMLDAEGPRPRPKTRHHPEGG